MNKLILGTVLLINMVLSACSPLYIPSAKHTHFLDTEGEANVAAYSGTNGFDIQGAYAITPKLGVVTAISAANKTDSSSNTEHQHFAIEAGVDYYKKLGDKGRFEALAGLGFGNAEAVKTITTKGSFSNFFLQSNIGFESRALDVGLAMRMNQVVFYKFETSNTTSNNSEAATFFEPSLFARLGWERLKLEVQMGLATPLQRDINFQYESLTVALGIRYNWNVGK